MKFVLFPLLVICPLVVAAAASNDEFARHYFSNQSLQLNEQEKQALAISQQSQNGVNTLKPVAGLKGDVQFIYGRGQTQIVCSVLQVCDVALQPGELLNNYNVGDPRFTVEPAITNRDANQQLHLLIKALDVGLESSMVVTTDRRTYHFRLRSTRSDYMASASFIYPEEVNAKWLAIQQQQKQHDLDYCLPEASVEIGKLDFNYRVKGRARFLPVRVYNDGQKTVIEMPKAMQHGEAPALLLLKHQGVKDDAVLVNYRLQGTRYLVDTVFDKAILVAGVGASQQKITITRRP